MKQKSLLILVLMTFTFIGLALIQRTEAAEASAKTAPEDFPDWNPYQSYLGEIVCTVCHSGQTESRIYCLERHPKFDTKFKRFVLNNKPVTCRQE